MEVSISLIRIPIMQKSITKKQKDKSSPEPTTT